jgi:hypothetical protein
MLFTRCLPRIFNELANTTATLGSFYWLGFETSGLSPDKKRLAWLGAQRRSARTVRESDASEKATGGPMHRCCGAACSLLFILRRGWKMASRCYYAVPLTWLLWAILAMNAVSAALLMERIYHRESSRVKMLTEETRQTRSSSQSGLQRSTPGAAPQLVPPADDSGQSQSGEAQLGKPTHPALPASP